MVRIWLNHWFSTAYSIVELIKQGVEDAYVLGSNENECSVYKSICDEWYREPVCNDNEYVEFCLDFCHEHNVDVFMPRRKMLTISKNKHCFESMGVKVMTDNYDMISILNNKTKAYDKCQEKGMCSIPEYYGVTNVNDFKNAYETLEKTYDQVCFKFEHDEGGKSFRLIDNERKGYKALFKKQNTRMTFDDVYKALSEVESFPKIIVMPFLSGDEISADCLKTSKGNIIIPRIKTYSRVEKICFDNKIISMCSELLDEFRLECPCNIQFKYLNDTPFFLEINTRMSGGVQLSCAASGVNIPSLAVHKLLGQNKDWVIDKTDKYVTHGEVPLIVG